MGFKYSTIEMDFYLAGEGGGGGSGSSCDITNADPVPNDHGGLSAGTVIAGQSSCHVLETILFPNQHPYFINFTMDSQDSNLEIGETVTGNVRTFTWSIGNSSELKPNSIAIYDVNDGNYLVSNLANDGTEDVDIGTNKTFNTPGTYTWKIEGEATDGTIFSRNYTISWNYVIYYGAHVDVSPDETTIKNNFSNRLSDTPAGSYTYSAPSTSSYFYIVYPDSLGDINSWIDTDTDYSVDYVYDGTIDITNSIGITTTYRYLRTNYKQDVALNSAVTA